jgi:hypothetical protein
LITLSFQIEVAKLELFRFSTNSQVNP